MILSLTHAAKTPISVCWMQAILIYFLNTSNLPLHAKGWKCTIRNIETIDCVSSHPKTWVHIFKFRTCGRSVLFATYFFFFFVFYRLFNFMPENTALTYFRSLGIKLALALQYIIISLDTKHSNTRVNYGHSVILIALGRWMFYI